MNPLKRFEIKNKKPFRLSLGTRGEMLSWSYLIQQGYKILEKNYRCAVGEIDVIAQKGKRLAFIEIKTRRTYRFGRPEEAVTRTKQRKLVRLAQWYLKEKKLETVCVSFDVVAVTWPSESTPEFRLIENAFAVDE